ncbi:choline ABC transporter substrate-binding protein, partial [Pseudomonas syringae pv. tagetis]
GYAQASPNVGKLLTNLRNTNDMQNSIMAQVANKKHSNSAAAKARIKANPAVQDKWLDGLKTIEAKDGLASVKAKF